GRYMRPAELGLAPRELLGNGAVVLFGMESAVFAGGIAQQNVQKRPGVGIQLSVATGDRAGVELVLLPDSGVHLRQKGAPVRGFHLLQLLGERIRYIVHAARLSGRMVRAHDEAGKAGPAVADTRDVPPGIRRIRGVDPNRIAVDAPRWLFGGLIL